MEYICKLCNKKIENNSHFWDYHRQKISDYFHQYEPRLTKTGGKVIFKRDIESYFEIDFNDLTERNKWVKENLEDAKEYFVSLLIKRKEKKNLIYAPGQALLSLTELPKIAWFEKNFDRSYNEICKSLGFKIKYTNRDIDIDLSSPLEIQIDTREQLPLIFSSINKIVNEKLNYGDIALSENHKISIERKSLNDLCGTLSKGYDRFKEELKRAKKDSGYIVILCESSINDFKSLEYLPQTKNVKASYSWLSKRIRDLYLEFDNIQFVFASGRKHAVKIAEIILRLGKKVKKTDLQYLVDCKKI